MTKLLDEAIDRVAHLPDERQNELAELLLMGLDDDVEIPTWQKDILDERLADLAANPDAGIPLDEVIAQFRGRWTK